MVCSYRHNAMENAHEMRNNNYLLSERGYAKLIKIMDSDKAWEVHDKLIDEYFTMKKVINSDK